MRAHVFIAFMGLCALIGACSPGPAPSLYFLDSTLAPPRYEPGAPTIGLAEITLPAYARRQPIANRTDDHRIVLDDDHRWAVPPTEAVSGALSRALEAHLRGPVVLRPYPRGFEPDIQVRVTFDRFLRGGSGDAELVGQYIIRHEAADDAMLVRRFQITGPAARDGYDAFMRSVAEALDTLGARIAQDAAATP